MSFSNVSWSSNSIYISIWNNYEAKIFNIENGKEYYIRNEISFNELSWTNDSKFIAL